ncbi:cadherin-like protein 26 isoform X2 [Lepisosteus oculatus]|uniref:cadherin-like protein 26 isoform X2 n=1 Tax=Lepisosteus oculatus TaxID=7918 RepID=UPI0035F52DDB
MKPVIILLLLAVLDVTDSQSIRSRQKRAWIIDSLTIEEENPGPFPYSLGTIELESEYRMLFTLHGSGVDEDPKGILQINPATGEIRVLGKVDYEKYHKLKLQFEAKNASTGILDTRLGVEINILDINDHPPTFQNTLYETTVKESTYQGNSLIIVSATDLDKPDTTNSTFSYRIASVSPMTKDVEFTINEKGTVSFKGCLDYEQTEKYTIIVEAKDHGEKVKLSSSTTVLLTVQDVNDNLPIFLSPKLTVKVKERYEGVTALRIKVNDKDKKSTSAWNAKYIIEDDKDGNFQITTDPETNDGILTVVKPLDFEKCNGRNLSVTVMNEEDYSSCTVKKQNPTGRWNVEMKHYDASKRHLLVLMKQTVEVILEDVNDPPEFTPAIKNIYIAENTETGHELETMTAVDLDDKFAGEFVYEIGNDPAGWVTVDPKNGVIKTIKKVDRESSHVVNNTYTVLIHAVDKGIPPMTGTGTLIIHIRDENDNVPFLRKTNIDMCSGAGATNITPYDLDEDPFSGPFRFQLVNEKDLEGKWRLDPTYGHSVDLIKESDVFSGVYEVSLKIFDKQEQYSIQNLTVTVCDCVSSGPANCRFRKSPATQMGGSAIGIIFASLFLLLGLLLLGFLTCGVKKSFMILDDDSTNTFIKSNIETPGTDCTVPNTAQKFQMTEADATNNQHVKNYYGQAHKNIFVQNVNIHRSQSNNQFSKIGQQVHHYSQMGSEWSQQTVLTKSINIERMKMKAKINKKVLLIQGNGNELHDYPPHIYADEGEPMSDPELDAISIDEQEFVSDQLNDLGPRFINLATICMSSLKTLRQNN